MATVINNPGGTERVIERETDSGAGWVVALVIVVAVLLALFAWARYYNPNSVASPGGTNINVTLPNTGTDNTGGTNGNGGTNGSGSTY